jgi:peptidyl-prolyl cis-trans isomerase SurA
LVQEGLQHLDIALTLSPDYEDAVTYKSLLLREKVRLASSDAEKSASVSEADQFNKGLETRRKNPTVEPARPEISPSGTVLQQLTDETLLLQRAKDMGLSADIEIVKTMDRLRQDRNLPTMEALEKEMAAQGYTLDKFKEQVAVQYLSSQVLQREVYTNVVVTTEEMRNYYDAHLKDFDRPAGIHLREITIVTATRGAEEIASQLKKAEEALAALKKGDDFGATAAKYSESPTAKDGGAFGFFAKGELAPWMEEVSNRLEKGQVSDVITAPGAFMIFKLDDKHNGGILPFELAKKEVADILWKQAVKPKVTEYLTKLRSGALVK